MKIITRKEAISKKQGMYFTGKPCVNGHIDERYVKNSNCIICEKNRYHINKKKGG